MATHYSKYDELLEGPEAKPMLDNDKIAGDAGDAGKARNTEDAGDGRIIKHIGHAEDKRHAGHIEHA